MCCSFPVILLYKRDNKSNAKQWNPSWPKWHSYQPLSTLAGLSKILFLYWEKCLGRINELLHFGQLDDRAFIWPELFLFRGAGAGLIRDRPAAALSLVERLADPCCLIGTRSLLTRACYQQGKQTGSARHCSDQLSTVPRKTRRTCPRNTWPINERNRKLMSF